MPLKQLTKGVITFIINTSEKKLTICDSGKGIAQGSSGQLFTPFFITKRDGQGLGLMITKEILLNHSFQFSLQTVKSGNTEFIINF